jgi:hypothetical protein
VLQAVTRLDAAIWTVKTVIAWTAPSPGDKSAKSAVADLDGTAEAAPG